MRIILFILLTFMSINSYSQSGKKAAAAAGKAQASKPAFVWVPEKFADVKVIRYQLPGFEKLSLKQKKLVYYLTQAGLSGRDIIWDQNYRYNLGIRKAIQNILTRYKGDKKAADWGKFVLYAKKMYVANGIHHHYGSDKMLPEFSRAYFESLLKATKTNLKTAAIDAMFSTTADMKKVNLDPAKGLVEGSAVNFYDKGIHTAEVEGFYERIINSRDPFPISYGLNSKLVRGKNGELVEKVWKVDGMYGAAIKQIVKWLDLASTVAENEKQKNALKLLIEYYKSGDLKKWDEYNIAWAQATDGDIDYINGFVEVYLDPKGYKGSYENIVQVKDFEASEQMKVVAESAQWFEDHSPILPEHKKKNVVGVSYKVVNAVGESGDANPMTPIGVNLPNADWIRKKYGSKSVSLGNIQDAYNNADGPGLLTEFSHDEEEVNRFSNYGALAGKLHTALHEVIGHASGQLEDGVGSPNETLKNYFSALEEARADLVALYYLMDQKLVDMKLIPSLEVGKAEYDQYIKNGIMLQLRRIEPGKSIEEAHMRNRAMIANWVFEKGKKDNVISKENKNGKTYFEINDYNKLRDLFGQLLREVQRIKSHGDFQAGKDLIENYGVKVDPALHNEVLNRSKALNIPPYGAFMNPRLTPVKNVKGAIVDIKVEYPKDFLQLMLEYDRVYGFLPEEN